MRSIFWIVSAVLVAVVTHLTYVLFVPTQNFNSSIDEALKNQQANKFTVLDSDLQTKLMPFVSATDLVMLCKFDVSKRPVKISMIVPDGYWTLSVYTFHGRQAYALNDRQADARSFSVKLVRAKGLFERMQSFTSEDAEPSFEEVGWKVDLPEDRGLAFLWMPHSDTWRRREDMAELMKSTCTAVDE